ncbi:MAG: class D beta-lactamase [Lachnospiraceae bacterium]|nr:class D beta-lactamase [Lachnospiraceae bacterium]
MKQWKRMCWIAVCTLILSGCADNYSIEEKMEQTEIEQIYVPMETETQDLTQSVSAEPKVTDVDWSEYFDGLNGAAVIYDASGGQYMIYNRELASTRRSPCSTFKIISSLTALENGLIEPKDSVRKWSGEVFWNEDWNRDIDFGEAFRTSCVWYYRQVVNDIGKDAMQRELEKLHYGNCDLSDWEGRLNTNNNNRALTGFWIESSLLISPKEQVEVMEHIFSENADYSKETQKELKQVMLVGQDETDIPIYGKTGMGMAEGIVVDAWFTGFAEDTDGNIYFCVYLGRTDGKNVSSSLARDIAIQLVTEYHDVQ